MRLTNSIGSIEAGGLVAQLAAGWHKPNPVRRRMIVAITLALADVVAMVAALIAARIVGLVVYGNYGSTGLIECAIEALWLSAIYWFAGLYSGCGPSPFERLRLRTVGAAVFCALHVGLHGTVSLAGILHACVLFLALVAFGHYAEAVTRLWLERQHLWAERALIIGDGARAEQLVAELMSRPMLGIRPVAAFTPARGGDHTALAAGLADLPAISSLDALSEPIDVAIAVNAASLAAFEQTGEGSAKIESVLLLTEGSNGQSLWLPTRALGGSVGMEVGRFGQLDQSPSIKRAIDLLIVSLVALPAAILVGIAALAVRIVDGGPIFYTQRRIGQDGHSLGVLKVRSMYQDAEQRLVEHLNAHPEARHEWERHFKLRNDPRILPFVGRIIRKSSIDELPQLWNVLRGDMSLVGPRPFPEYHVNGFDEEFREMRSTVQPGLTGLWQVGARSDGDLKTQKAEDLFYIRNRSLWLDLYIMLQTVPALLSGRGAR